MNVDKIFQDAEASDAPDCMSRIDETHPASFFVGIDQGRRAVMIQCAGPIADLPRMTALTVESRQRANKDWVLFIRLERADLKAQFTRLVEDLGAVTRRQGGDPGQVAAARLACWLRLLSRGPDAGLEDHELKGLAAEIMFLLEEAIPAFGPGVAIAGWCGPFDQPKDFVFPEVEVEVKALRRGAKTIGISSAEQLTDEGRPLFLWCQILDLQPAGSGAHSLASLVQQLREAVHVDPVAAETLETALLWLGYEDRADYTLREVVAGRPTCFRVSGDFPRLQRPTIPQDILRCHYEIRMAAVDRHIVASWRQAHDHG